MVGLRLPFEMDMKKRLTPLVYMLEYIYNNQREERPLLFQFQR